MRSSRFVPALFSILIVAVLAALFNGFITAGSGSSEGGTAKVAKVRPPVGLIYVTWSGHISRGYRMLRRSCNGPVSSPLVEIKIVNTSKTIEHWLYQIVVFKSPVPQNLTIDSAVHGPNSAKAFWTNSKSRSSDVVLIGPLQQKTIRISWNFIGSGRQGPMADGIHTALADVRMLPSGVPSGIGGLRFDLEKSQC